MTKASFWLASVAVSAALVSQPGCAQVDGRLEPVSTQSIPYSAPAAPASKTEWSGESGASGHPLMAADTIRSAAASFDRCLERMAPEAVRRGVARERYAALTRALTPDL